MYIHHPALINGRVEYSQGGVYLLIEPEVILVFKEKSFKDSHRLKLSELVVAAAAAAAAARFFVCIISFKHRGADIYGARAKK